MTPLRECIAELLRRNDPFRRAMENHQRYENDLARKEDQPLPYPDASERTQS